LKSRKPGKGDALRKEKGAFCLLFVAAWRKSKASGGAQPAGFAGKNLFSMKAKRPDKRRAFVTVIIDNLA